jgi:nitrate/TMAO reductase-like tetraheme cytochrome c subunit
LASFFTIFLPKKVVQRKSIFLVLAMALVVFVLIRCGTAAAKDPRGSAFAGSSSCMSCHREVYTSYSHTAHFHTSSRATASLLKPLHGMADSFSFPGQTVAVEHHPDGLYQSLYSQGTALQSHRFDIIFGAGKKAQTFAYWQGNQLFQLSLSFFNDIPGWANSPGFPASHANFDRMIVSRCFECHGSFVQRGFDKPGSLNAKEVLDSSTIIYGIDCERCHGAAAAHVQFQSEHPGEKHARYITRWADLNRQRKLDACAVCHSGNDQETQRSTFWFQPGDTLSNFYYPDFGTSMPRADVHGKQTQLLAASLCFRSSPSMECTTCHTPHADQPAAQLAAAPCLTCHQPDRPHFCGKYASLGQAIMQNCVDCHMPPQASQAITFQKNGATGTSSYFLHTHRIAVYPEQTASITQKLQKHAANPSHNAQ